MSMRRRAGVSLGARGGTVILLALLVLSAWSLAWAPAGALASGGVWRGTAEGIRVDDHEINSDELTSSSVANYQVELSYSFSVSHGVVTGTGNGYYTDAHWHLSGVNGKEGSFDCEPPVTGEPFKVEVSGQASGHDVLLDLAIPDATETNEDTPCGANYTAYATSSHFMAESLEAVGGDALHLSSDAPTSKTLEKTSETGDSEDQKTSVYIWSFSVTPPGPAEKESQSDESSGHSCSLSLTHLAAKPSPGAVGKPVVVSFHVSAAAKASLLVTPAGGAPSIVASRSVPKGPSELVWGGWLGKLPAPAGQYALSVKTKACGKTRSKALTVSLH